jgi:hypothetical protein
MSFDDLFFVARVNADDLSERLDWVATVNEPYQAVDPIDLDDELLEAIFDMYITTYSAIDSRFNIPDKYALFEYNRWLIIEDDHGNLLGFVLLKTTAAGFKIGLTASDGSPKGRQTVRGFHERVFFVEGIYAEVSDAMERIVLKAHVPKVRATDAESVLEGKQLEVHEDGYHYTRSITRIGDRVKIMVGKPIL